MKPFDGFALFLATLLGILFISYRRYAQRQNLSQREPSQYFPLAAWLRAGMFFCFFYLVAWATGTLQVVLSSPLAKAPQLVDRNWWIWVIGLTTFILIAYWGIWARYTIRFERRLDPFPQIVFGLLWGTALGLMLVSLWRIAVLLGAGWQLWQQWLLAYAVIGIWQWLLMDMYWDVYISPEHDSPKSIKLKTLVTHIPNVTLCLVFIALYGNYALFIGWQTLALVGCSLNMRMPAPWSREKTLPARRVRSIFWGLPRCGGYLPADPVNDPYLKAAHLN